MPKCLLSTIRRYRASPHDCDVDSRPASGGCSVDGSDNSDCSTGASRPARNSGHRSRAKKKRSVSQLSVVTRYYMNTECHSRKENAAKNRDPRPASVLGVTTDDCIHPGHLPTTTFVQTDPAAHKTKPCFLKSKRNQTQMKIGGNSSLETEGQGREDNLCPMKSATGDCSDSAQHALHTASPDCVGFIRKDEPRSGPELSLRQHPLLPPMRYASLLGPNQTCGTFRLKPTVPTGVSMSTAEGLKDLQTDRCNTAYKAVSLPLAQSSSLGSVGIGQCQQSTEGSMSCVVASGLLLGSQLMPVSLMQSLWFQPQSVIYSPNQIFLPTAQSEKQTLTQQPCESAAVNHQYSRQDLCTGTASVAKSSADRDDLCQSPAATDSPLLKCVSRNITSMETNVNVCTSPEEKTAVAPWSTAILPTTSPLSLAHDTPGSTKSGCCHEGILQPSIAFSTLGICSDKMTPDIPATNDNSLAEDVSINNLKRTGFSNSHGKFEELATEVKQITSSESPGLGLENNHQAGGSADSLNRNSKEYAYDYQCHGESKRGIGSQTQTGMSVAVTPLPSASVDFQPDCVALTETALPTNEPSCSDTMSPAFFSSLLQSCIPLLEANTPTAIPHKAQRSVNTSDVGKDSSPADLSFLSSVPVSTADVVHVTDTRTNTADGSKGDVFCGTTPTSPNGPAQRFGTSTATDMSMPKSLQIGPLRKPDERRKIDCASSECGRNRSEQTSACHSPEPGSGMVGQLNTRVPQQMVSNISERHDKDTRRLERRSEEEHVDDRHMTTKNQSTSVYLENRRSIDKQTGTNTGKEGSDIGQQTLGEKERESVPGETSFTRLQSCTVASEAGSGTGVEGQEGRRPRSRGETSGNTYSSQWISAVAAYISAQPSPFSITSLPAASPLLSASIPFANNIPNSYLYTANPSSAVVCTPFNNITNQGTNSNVGQTVNTRRRRGQGSRKSSLPLDPDIKMKIFSSENRSTKVDINGHRDTPQSIMPLYSTATKRRAEGMTNECWRGAKLGDGGNPFPKCSECCQAVPCADHHSHTSDQDEVKRAGGSGGADKGSQVDVDAGDTRNKCAVCSRVFTRSWLLKGHMRTHTGERPFRCTWPQCQRAFADKSNLRSHTLIHTTTAKSFTCPKCSRAFSQKRYLHKHMLEVCRII